MGGGDHKGRPYGGNIVRAREGGITPILTFPPQGGRERGGGGVTPIRRPLHNYRNRSDSGVVRPLAIAKMGFWIPGDDGYAKVSIREDNGRGECQG